MTTTEPPSAIQVSSSTYGYLDQIRLHKFHGGIHPPENKLSAENCLIKQCCVEKPLPARLYIPLCTPQGHHLLPLVETGSKVLKGQVVTRDEAGRHPPQHAPTSGIIEGVEQIPSSHASAIEQAMLILKTDGNDQWIPQQPATLKAVLQREKTENIEKIFAAGIIGMGGAGFPTATKITSTNHLSPTEKIHTLLINGAECEPYISCDDGLMQKHPETILLGAIILAKCLEVSKIQFAIEDNKPRAIKALRQARDDLSLAIGIIKIPTKYPSGGEKQLIEIISGQQVTSGKYPTNIGYAVQNVATAMAVYEALIEDKPLVSRVITLTGKQVPQPGNYSVPLGMPIADLLLRAGVKFESCHQIIMGGPMMGTNLVDGRIPVLKTTNCLIVPSAGEFAAPVIASPCIRCGLCTDVCPVSLLPQQLYWHSKAEEWHKTEELNLFDCIECGACSWVCPSNLPLVEYYRFAKDTVKEKKIEQMKMIKARFHHEKRQTRLAKQQEEKAARRHQKTEVAKNRKLRKEQRKDITREVNKQSVADAVARVKAKKAARKLAQASTMQKNTLIDVEEKPSNAHKNENR